MSRIHITVNPSPTAIREKRIERSAKAILSALGYTESELSILVVGDEEMADLNERYRGIDTTTDVLAFPMMEGEFGDVCPEMLGDIVISAPTAERMGQRHACSPDEIVDLLLVHGVLHLAGYDHENSEEESRIMADKTLELLQKLGHERNRFDWFLGD